MSVTAWELIGTEQTCKIAGGRAVWEAVDVTRNDRVRLQRMEVGATAADGIRVVTRYVHPDTRMIEVCAHCHGELPYSEETEWRHVTPAPDCFLAQNRGEAAP